MTNFEECAIIKTIKRTMAFRDWWKKQEYLIGTKSVTADHLGKSCSGGLLFSGPPGGAFEILQRQVLP